MAIYSNRDNVDGRIGVVSFEEHNDRIIVHLFDGRVLTYAFTKRNIKLLVKMRRLQIKRDAVNLSLIHI